MRRHIVLVGLPGSGKTTVGQLVAARLGAPFRDLDRAIEERAGKPVARIFEEDGEAAFRALEGVVGTELLNGPPAVIAPGGGFVQDASVRRRALESGLVVYLETPPAVAARRLASALPRPLLVGYVPELRLRQLLERRECVYLQAQQRVDTSELALEQVAERVAELARSEGGW